MHFAPIDLLLEFLLEDSMAGMTLFEDLSLDDQFFFQHLLGALVVARGEEWSQGCRGKDRANCGDIIREASPSTPKIAAGSVTKGLATLPRVVTTLRSKGKGKGKAQEEEEEEFEIKTLLCWQKALTVVDIGMRAGVVFEKAKEKSTILLERQQAFKQQQGACDNCWAENDPEGCYGKLLRSTGRKFAKRIAVRASSVQQTWVFVEWQKELANQSSSIQVRHSSLLLPTLQDGSRVRGSEVAKGKQQEKSKEVVESKDDASNSNDDVPLVHKQTSSSMLVTSTKQPWIVASKEGEQEAEDVEMREMTPLATVAEVKPAASRGEVEAEAIEVNEDAVEDEEKV
ncbi:hypothetical protein C0989_002615 [Termitomyces sp. Mn162]|nr:hypothetical protein C0989_002615 [Termitomyces sp. Mn162]